MGNEVGQIKASPNINIEFKTLATTAIQRSERGIVCLILKDTKKTVKWNTLKTIADLKEKEWDAKNVNFILEKRLCFSINCALVLCPC